MNSFSSSLLNFIHLRFSLYEIIRSSVFGLGLATFRENNRTDKQISFQNRAKVLIAGLVKLQAFERY